MRTIEVSGNQGRGNPPAFHTKTHRVCEQEDRPAPKEIGHAWMAVICICIGCGIAAVIVIYNMPKG